MKISHKIIRTNHLLSIKINIVLKNFIQRSTIVILKNNKNVTPISITNGFIKENKIFINSTSADIVIPYTEGTFDVIWSYPTEQDVILSESQTFITDKIKINEIDENEQKLSNNLIKSHYNFHNLSQWLTVDNTFGWRAIISYEDDIKIRFIKKGKMALLSLGEKTYGINHSDYLFNIDGNQSELYIPKSLINKLNNKIVACFILCKGDFYNIDNLYYKIPISNFIELNISSDASELTDPLGNIFNA